MKLQKITKIKSKLIKLQIIKSKVYLQKNQIMNSLVTVLNHLELVEVSLKQALRVIYYTHISNKRIIFVGIPKSNQKKFLKILNKTNHISIPESVWVNGILSNKVSLFKYIKKYFTTDHLLTSLFQITTKPDLVVIFNTRTNSNLLQEIGKLRIPTIILGFDGNPKNDSLYCVPGNFSFLNNKLNNIIFILLNSIFKK